MDGDHKLSKVEFLQLMERDPDLRPACKVLVPSRGLGFRVFGFLGFWIFGFRVEGLGF